MLIREQRLQRAAQAMREQHVDMWITYGRELMETSEPMLRYILTMEVFNHLALVLTKEGDRIVIAGAGESEELVRMGIFTRVIPISTGAAGICGHLSDVIRGFRPDKVAINISEKDPTADGLSYTGYMLLRRALDAAGFQGKLVPSHSLMKYVRANKSSQEVDRIRHSVQEAMKIFEEARPHMKRGMSGMDIQRLFQGITDKKNFGYAWTKHGNPFNSIGTRSSYLCKRPADDVFIEPGDVVNVDFGIVVDEFASDNQRTFYALEAGEEAPPEEVQRAFETLGRLNQAVAAHMKPGIKSGALLQYGNEFLRRGGYPEITTRFGHELGRFAHDGCIFSGSSSCEPEIDASLLEGMTFTLEPAIITSRGRVCREEVVTVTAQGGRFLSDIQQDIWLIR